MGGHIGGVGVWEWEGGSDRGWGFCPHPPVVRLDAAVDVIGVPGETFVLDDKLADLMRRRWRTWRGS